MHHAHIDRFAYQDSAIHRVDSRVKFMVVVVFTAVVLSLEQTSPSILACYAVGPFAVLVCARIPLRFVIKHTILVSPFILLFALSCPFYDRTPLAVAFGPFAWKSTAGWMRCYTIAGKFGVTMFALICLVSTTRFSDLLAGLQRMTAPRILIMQLGFLYRYIFVVIDWAHHILRARAARKLRNLGFKREVGVAASMVGTLIIRSIDTAEHISFAMQARGFDGTYRTISKLRIRSADLLFAIVAGVFIFGLYFFVRPVLC